MNEYSRAIIEKFRRANKANDIKQMDDIIKSMTLQIDIILNEHKAKQLLLLTYGTFDNYKIDDNLRLLYSLKISIDYRLTNLLKYLVEHHNVNVYAGMAYALRVSAARADIITVKYIIEQCGADKQSMGAAIHEAMTLNHIEIVKYLILQGADVSSITTLAFSYIFETGDLEFMKLLVAHGGDIHRYNEFPLIIASKYGHVDIVKYILEQHKVDIHVNEDRAIKLAMIYNHFETTKYLASKYNNSQLSTILSWAETNGYLLNKNWDALSTTNYLRDICRDVD